MFPAASFNAPALIVILISPPGKLLIVNGNVFVLLSELVVTVPKDKFVNLTPSAVTVTFDELSVLVAKAVSSVPWKFNLYVLASALYVPSSMSFAHVGAVPSAENVYVFAALLFPAVSCNAPALIVTFTLPPAKLFNVIGNVFLFPLTVAVPIV